VFLLCLGPLLWLGWAAFAHRLGANPIEATVRFTGDWGLRFLLLTLAVTPLRRLTGQAWLMRLRRMLGLYAFFYACIHMLSYVVLDQFFAWDEIVKDILKRPFITVGVTIFALLIPLALTSNQYSMRVLGGRRWQRLHQLVYVIAAGAVLHYLWLVKADVSSPVGYGLVLVILLGYRAWYQRRQRTVLRRPAIVN
jgi:sulfoxide reductase heme-binding subunit YedZ